MKKTLTNILLAVVGVLTFNCAGCQSDKKQNKSQMPPLPIERGVSAPFAGFIGDDLLVGGGCNFPGIPAAEGGKKVYYADVFTLKSDGDSLKWEQVHSLPSPIAYGATVEIEGGLICIGGMNEHGSLKDVFSIRKGAASGEFVFHQLPTLPETIDNAAATRIGRSLYVTGGSQGNGGNSLYTLCLDTDTVWTKLADYPGAKRLQPVLLASEEELYLFGGFEVKDISQEESSTKEKVGIISSDFIVYTVKQNKWSEPKPIPSMQDGGKRALVGCAGTRVNNQFMLAGGVNHDLFKAAIEGKAPTDYMKRPVEWYQFNKDILIYHLQTQRWSVVPNTEGFNKAGGSLLHHNDLLYMVCGEIKPGIRTSEIATVNLKELLSEE